LYAKDGVRTEAKTVPITPAVIAAIRLLVLTGARKSEILTLRWDWIDLDARRINFPDSKTGEKTMPLSPQTLEGLRGIERVHDNPHVIVGKKPGAHLVNLKDPWLAIREDAGLDDVRIHDLRHSFASVGAAAGLSLPIIGALLGHTQSATTERYAHLHDDPLRIASTEIGTRIEAALSSRSHAAKNGDDAHEAQGKAGPATEDKGRQRDNGKEPQV
jgi:integrase